MNAQKHFRILVSLIAIVFTLSCAVFLASCKKDTAGNETSSVSSVSSVNDGSHNSGGQSVSAPADSSGQSGDGQTVDDEVAMENFFDKLAACDYSISSDFISISVYSEDLVYFDYADVLKTDCAYMTVNENETFYCEIADNALIEDSISFYDDSVAADAIFGQLPYCWVYVSEGNIWNSFTNVVEEDLKYLIINNDVKLQIAESYAGIGTMFLSRVDEAYLTLDKEDPTTANILLSFTEQEYQPLADVEITISFGVERPSVLPTDSWANDPERAYPDPQTEWNSADEVAFVVVFNQGYDIETELLPFPDFATYAFKRDAAAVQNLKQIRIRDSRATEKDLADYVKKLKDNGFKEAVEAYSDGTVIDCYQKQVDDFGDGFYSYSSVTLGFDDGIDIVCKKYYNYKTYEGIEDINALIESKRFVALSQKEGISDYKAYDFTFEYVEGLAGLFAYDLVLDVEMAFDDPDTAEKYVGDYLALLTESGYTTKNGVNYVYETEENQNKFEYNPGYVTAGVLQFRFKSQVYLGDEQANAAITEAGFPSVELEKYDSTTKEITSTYRYLYNLVHDKVYLVTLTFDTVDDAYDFLDLYLDGKLLPNEYYMVDPMRVKVPYKDLAYYNEDKGLIVALVDPTGATTISLTFIKVAEGFEPLY